MSFRYYLRVRYGGEELMAVLPDTHPALAEMVAERLAECRIRPASG